MKGTKFLVEIQFNELANDSYLEDILDIEEIESINIIDKADIEIGETDDEEVAHNLSKIIKSGGDEKAIAEILKQMKKSNYI